MGKIGVIACSKRKMTVRAPAFALYQGRTFKVSYRLLRALGCERILILSALHGVVDSETELGPYIADLYKFFPSERRAWASKTNAQLRTMLDADAQIFVIAPAYYAAAVNGIPHTRFYAGLPQGKLYCVVARAAVIEERKAA